MTGSDILFFLQLALTLRVHSETHGFYFLLLVCFAASFTKKIQYPYNWDTLLIHDSAP